jgi:predicted ABC-type ATPase
MYSTVFVLEGAHNIEPDIIERRYKAGIKFFFNIYSDFVDFLLVYDNSKTESELIAEKGIENEKFIIHNSQKFECAPVSH